MQRPTVIAWACVAASLLAAAVATDKTLPALLGLGALALGLAAVGAWYRSLRRQVQLRTRELERDVSLLRSALESTADGLLVVDRTGQVTAFNDRFLQMWGVPRELSQTRAAASLLGHMLAQLEDTDRFRARLRELDADASGESRDFLELSDGRAFERYSLPQRLDGVTVGRVWSFRDISARRRSDAEQARLEQSVQRSESMAAMGALVAGVAHEVRNPLFNLTATLDAFEARFPPQQHGYSRYVDALRRELNRLAALMRGLLDYGRPPHLTLRSGDAAEALKDAAAVTESLASLAQVRVRVDLPRPLPPVLMDQARLVQAVHNLIQNAIQHSPSGAEVVVSAQEELESNGAWIACVVRDSGPGFRTEDLPRVFEPFFTRRRGGTGLGLSLVQSIVEQHGGSVVAANHSEGGALVTVRLPAADSWKRHGASVA